MTKITQYNENVKINGSFTLNNGTQVAGYVLTSDSGGTGTWQAAASGASSNAKYTITTGLTSGVTVTVPHNLGTLDIVVQVKDLTSNELIGVTVDNYQLNSVDITANGTIASSRIIILAAGGSGSSSSDIYVTGATTNNGLKTYTFTNNSGGTFTVNGLTDITITGGTFTAGTATFTNNTGGTFTVTGFTSGSGGTNAAYATTTGLTSGITVTVPHNLGTLDVLVQIKDLTLNQLIDLVVDNYQLNSVDVTSNITMASARIVILASGGSSSGSTVPITTNVIPKGTGPSITDGTWAFSGNTLYPLTDESNIGISGTNRVDTIYLASNLDFASDLSFKENGTERAKFYNQNFSINAKNSTPNAYMYIGNDNVLLVMSAITVSSAPQELAYNSSNNKMYVCTPINGNVQTIDCSTNLTSSTISVSTNPTYIAYDSFQNAMYVTDPSDFVVTPIDCATDTITGTPISMDATPSFIAYNSQNKTMYVSEDDGNVQVINTLTNTITGSSILIGSSPQGLAYNNTSNRMYVCDIVDDTVYVINCNTNVVTTAITVSSGPQGIAYNSSNNTMYVCCFSSGVVDVINCNTNTVTGSSISVGAGCYDITYDPVNNKMWVTNSATDTVKVINCTTNTVVRTYPSSPAANQRFVAYDSVDFRMYVTETTGSVVRPYNTFVNPNTSSIYIKSFSDDIENISQVLNIVDYTGTTILSVGSDRRLVFKDGNQGTGKVLMSDSGGTATWSAVTTSVPLGSENIFVSKLGSDSTGTNSNLALPFSSITAGLTKASTLTPSSTNIINVIVYGGAYVENITVPSFVNLISATDNELIYNGVSYSTVSTKSAGAKRPVYVNGSITVSTDNISIIGINCNTLNINHLSTNSNFSHMVVGTTISSSTTTVSGNFYDIHSDAFFAQNIVLSGSYNKCSAGNNSFCNGATTGGTISGIMKEVIAGSNSFCYGGTIGGTISGTLTDIIGTDFCFASAGSGVQGTGGTISGTLTRCIATQRKSFATGVFQGGVISGTLIDCQQQGGGSGNPGGFASCVGGIGGQQGGTISGTLIRCVADGSVGNTSNAFAFGTNGVMSGLLKDCVSKGINGFNNATMCNGATVSGTLDNVSAGTATALAGATVTGILRNSRLLNTAGVAVTVGSGGRIENCQLKGSTTSIGGGSVTADIRHCDLFGGGIAGTVTNATATPYNTNDAGSLF